MSDEGISETVIPYLHRILIEAGLNGMKQRDIVAKLSGRATGKQIEEYLEALASDHKVQRFSATSGARGGRAPKIWRATTLLIED